VSTNAPLVAVEGIDGAGKSTVVGFLVKLLRERGHTVATYDFPFYAEPQYGPLVARFLRGDFGALAAAEPWFVGMLFAGNRAEMKGALSADAAAGHIVICDRFSYSNVAFQSSKLPPTEDSAAFTSWLTHLEFETFGTPRADVSFWLRVNPSIRPGATGDRGDRGYLNGRTDVHESDEALQRRVHAAYEHLAATREDIEAIECAPDGVLLAPEVIAETLYDRMEALDLLPARRVPET
jgi:dTMP kinase